VPLQKIKTPEDNNVS